MPENKADVEKEITIIGFFDPYDMAYFRDVGQVYAEYCVENIADVAKTLGYPNALSHNLQIRNLHDNNYEKFLGNYEEEGLSFRHFLRVMLSQLSSIKKEDYTSTVITKASKYCTPENIGDFKKTILYDCLKEKIKDLLNKNIVNNIIVNKLQHNILKWVMKGTETYIVPEDASNFWTRYKKRIEVLYANGAKRLVFVCNKNSDTYAKLKREKPDIQLEELQYSSVVKSKSDPD